jgi:hypothetical protein
MASGKCIALFIIDSSFDPHPAVRSMARAAES